MYFDCNKLSYDVYKIDEDEGFVKGKMQGD